MVKQKAENCQFDPHHTFHGVGITSPLRIVSSSPNQVIREMTPKGKLRKFNLICRGICLRFPTATIACKNQEQTNKLKQNALKLIFDLFILSSFSCSWINLNKHPWIVTRTDLIGWLECTLSDDARFCNSLTRDQTCQSHPVLYKNPSPTKNLFVILATNSIDHC